MKIDEAINMLNQAKDSGSKDVIFAFWEAKEFKRKENKTFTNNIVWSNITDYIHNNMDWQFIHNELQKMIDKIKVKNQ
jgi:hypothetical protein